MTIRSSCKNKKYFDDAKKVWYENRNTYKNTYFDTRLVKQGDVYALYDVEMLVVNLLKAARTCGDRELLADLADFILPVAQTLEKDANGNIMWICHDTEPTRNCAQKKLVGKEVILDSKQFLYIVTSLFHAIAQIPESERTPRMKDFLVAYDEPIQKQLLRWIQGVSSGNMNKVLFSLKTDPNVDKYAIFSDSVMWLLGDAVEYVAAKDITNSLPKETRDIFIEYLQKGSELIKQRTSFLMVTVDNKEYEIAGFDEGAWSSHADMAYASYTGLTFPTEINKKTSSTASMDMSHMRRIVHAFGSLYENRKVYAPAGVNPDEVFPNTRMFQGFARNIVYRVLQRDRANYMQQPLFSNYFDGSPGWYRVGYSSRDSF